jgi:hypothetical protein
VRTNFGRSPAVQLDLFFAASHSMEPGAHTVWMGCGLPRCSARSWAANGAPKWHGQA